MKKLKRGRPRSSKASKAEYLYGLGIAEMVRTKAARAAARWEKMLQRSEHYEFPANLKIVENMRIALSSMEKAVRGLSHVPTDWKPAVGAVGVPLFEEGNLVKIREEKREKYNALLDDPSELLKVVKVEGSTIICSGSSAKMPIKVPFPRAHVQLVQEDA